MLGSFLLLFRLSLWFGAHLAADDFRPLGNYFRIGDELSGTPEQLRSSGSLQLIFEEFTCDFPWVRMFGYLNTRPSGLVYTRSRLYACLAIVKQHDSERRS